MNKLLLIIDLQKDFINENTKHLPNKISNLMHEYTNVVFTRYINENNNIGVSRLNWNGCLTNEGKSIIITTENYPVIDKNTYTAYNNQLIKYIKENDIGEIDICGIDTECCVLKTALDFFENNYNVNVLQEYCACTHGFEIHNNAINILKRNIGMDRIK